jgi:hypothetical protein
MHSDVVVLVAIAYSNNVGLELIVDWEAEE